jgi:hypothetical protein
MSVQAVLANPDRLTLQILDNDEEFLAWYGSAPNFHQYVQGFCQPHMSVGAVRADQVQDLIWRIKGRQAMQPLPEIPGVPKNMARAFRGLYQSQLNALRNSNNPATAGQQAVLQGLIEVLDQFIGTLP